MRYLICLIILLALPCHAGQGYIPGPAIASTASPPSNSFIFVIANDNVGPITITGVNGGDPVYSGTYTVEGSSFTAVVKGGGGQAGGYNGDVNISGSGGEPSWVASSQPTCESGGRGCSTPETYYIGAGGGGGGDSAAGDWGSNGWEIGLAWAGYGGQGGPGGGGEGYVTSGFTSINTFTAGAGSAGGTVDPSDSSGAYNGGNGGKAQGTMVYDPSKQTWYVRAGLGTAPLEGLSSVTAGTPGEIAITVVPL